MIMVLLRLIRIVKMFRIIRIFKLARHSGALKALGKTSEDCFLGRSLAPGFEVVSHPYNDPNYDYLAFKKFP